MAILGLELQIKLWKDKHKKTLYRLYLWKQAAKKWRHAWLDLAASFRIYTDTMQEMEAEATRLSKAETRLRGLLRRVEWVGIERHVIQICPECRKGKVQGHTDDCKLAKELRDDN